MQPSRRKGKGRTRILYWFRTPPGVRVGRAALDEEAIRLIEANNPDLEFDWTRILKGQADTEAPVVERRTPRHERDRPGGRPPQERRAARPADPRPPADAALPPPTAEVITAAAAESLPGELEEAHGDPEEPMTAAHARLGSEGLSRLRARYAETMARITERIPDPEQQLQLKALAERLNPDAWVTEGDVNAGLESYEATFEALRGSIGTRRRKPAPPTPENE